MRNIGVFILFLIFLTGCSNTSEKAATISINSDSEYVNTFNDLTLGVLFDFNFNLPNADKRWVNLLVERYVDGEKDPDPLMELSYGNGPEEVEEGKLGFGLINPNTEGSLVFLYGPSVKLNPSEIEMENNTDRFASWEYAMGDEEVELELNETKVLAAYREKEGDSIRTVDLQDENEVQRIIQQDSLVLLLKIKIEEID